MEVAPEAVEVPEAGPQPSFWNADNRLVRAVGRIPLPLGAKLLIGFAVVATLLAFVAVLGLGALGQSNSRGEQLRRLQQKAVYFQEVLTDVTQLKNAIDYRLRSSLAERDFHSGLDHTIGNEFNQLCVDTGSSSRCVGAAAASPPPPLGLAQLIPVSLDRGVRDSLGTFEVIAENISPFSVGFGPDASDHTVLISADRSTAGFVREMRRAAKQTRTHANALVAANRRSYTHARDLLIGVGAGSLVLSLALGLLLSWSLVAPLRRTQTRLAAIAGGDFSRHVEVANRDEIGALAADVNRMNDELRRVYGELEAASRHKSDFLATMSHELRTPLNAIIGFSEVLHEQMFGELNERQLAYVNDVLEAGRHLLSLINDVLDLAKIESGKMELALSQVELPELLRSTISMHSEQASRNGIALTLTAEPAEIEVAADERRVRQIVFNLLSNAIKFTPADGRVDVSARLDDGQVEIAVADTGPGIPAEDQETIFEEFEQAADGKKVEGTGLGLPLSRKLVELHRGHLWVESEPGRGSIFRFTLPVGDESVGD
jgi:signal transduction histidine kinase